MLSSLSVATKEKLYNGVSLLVMWGVWQQLWVPLYAFCFQAFNSIIATSFPHITKESDIFWYWHLFGTMFISLSTYWITAIPLSYFDFYPTENMKSTQIQVQKGYEGQSMMNQPQMRRKFWKAIRLCITNQLFVSIPFICVTTYSNFLRAPQHSFDAKINFGIPSYFTVLLHFIVILLVQEVGFYYAHRLFHEPYFYERFHKVHHEFTAPFGATGIAAHPVEHLIANCTPVFLGPFLAGSHLSLVWFWITLAQANVCLVGHSGYHLPFVPSGEAHNWHHKTLGECFGPLGLLDAFHGTNTKFFKSVGGHRDFVYFSKEEFHQATKEFQDAQAKEKNNSAQVKPNLGESQAISKSKSS